MYELSVSLWNSPNVQGCVLKSELENAFSGRLWLKSVSFFSDVNSRVSTGYLFIEVLTNWENKLRGMNSMLEMHQCSLLVFYLSVICGFRDTKDWERDQLLKSCYWVVSELSSPLKYLKFVALSTPACSVPVFVPLSGGFCKWTQRNPTYADQPTAYFMIIIWSQHNELSIYLTLHHCLPLLSNHTHLGALVSCRRPNQRLILPLLMMTVFLRFLIVLKKKNQKMFYIRI